MTVIEKTIIIFVSIVALVLSKLPTLYFWFNTPPGLWFVKHISWFDAWDIQVYVSAIGYGEKFGVFLQNPYTTIPHTGVFIYQFYTIAGVINRIFHFDYYVLFHIISVFASIILIGTSFFLARSFFKDRLIRLAAFSTMVLGGGFGWINGLHEAVDITGAGFTMQYALERGHDALSTASLLLSFLFLFTYSENETKRNIFLSVLFAVINCAIHPPFIFFYIVTGSVIAFLHYRIQHKRSLFIYPILLSCIFCIYFLIFLTGLINNPGFAGIVTQKLQIYPYKSFILGFGLFLPFLIGNLLLVKDTNIKIHYVRIIFIIQVIFLFAGIGPSLYFFKGIFIWGIVLTFDGLQKIYQKKLLPFTSLIIVFLVFISFMTRIWNVYSLLNINKNNQFFFLRTNEGEFLQTMNHIPPGNILSLYRIGNYIPAYSDMRVYFGHKMQTPDGNTKLQTALAFYRDMDEQEQIKFLKDNSIQYVYYGLEEIQWRKNNNLPSVNPFSYFEKYYDANGIIVYRNHLL